MSDETLKVLKETTEEDLLKKYLEQTEIEVRQELAIMQLEKELAKRRSALNETRLTKNQLMNKLKGIPEPQKIQADLLKQIERLLPPFYDVGGGRSNY